MAISPNDRIIWGVPLELKHEALPWVTLVTCRGYDQTSHSYKYRVFIRAVLVEVK